MIVEEKDLKSRAELQAEILQLKEALPEVAIPPKIFLTDATPEAMQVELAEQRERSAVITDEGNLFDILAGLYSEGRSNLDVFLQGHAGGALRVKRKDRQVHLQKIAITLGLAVQPQVLNDLRGSKQRSFKGKGLLARFLYCLPKSNIGSRDVRKRDSIPEEVKSAYHAGIRALLDIPGEYDELGREKPQQIGLTNEARLLWEDFAQVIEKEQGPGGQFESIQDLTGKLPGQALRIAGLCHIAKITNSTYSTNSSGLKNSKWKNGCEKSKVEIHTMATSLRLCLRLIEHAQAAFAHLDNDSGIADAKWILNWIRAHVIKDLDSSYSFRPSDVHRTNRFKNGKVDRVNKALEVLRERNLISHQVNLDTKKPTYVRYVNPAVFLTT